MKRPIPILVDTSEVEGQNFGFNDPVFERIAELCGLGVTDYMTTPFLEDEIIAHIRKSASRVKPAVEKFRKEAKILSGSGRPDPLYEYLKCKEDDIVNTELNRYGAFKDQCQAISIPHDQLDVEGLRLAFLQGLAPFKNPRDPSGFVDAIILETALAWSTRSNRTLRLVSRDGDWTGFASRHRNIECHQSLGELIDYVESERPLQSSGGDIGRLAERSASKSSDSSAHLAEYPLLASPGIPETNRVPALLSCSSFGDVVQHAAEGALALTIKARGVHVRALRAFDSSLEEVTTRFGSHVSHYVEIRNSETYRVAKRSIHPVWPEESIFYLSALLIQQSNGQLPATTSTGRGRHISSLDSFVMTAVRNLSHDTSPSAIRTVTDQLRSVYVSIGDRSGSVFSVQPVISIDHVSKTG